MDPALRTTATLLATMLLAGCGGQPTPGDPTPANGVAAPSADAPATLARLGYLDNLLVRVDAGDWTYDEGLRRSMRMIIGGAPQSVVLLERPLASLDLTGLIAAGRGFARDQPRAHATYDIERALESLVFTTDQFHGMALDPAEPAPTAPRRTQDPAASRPTPGATDVEVPEEEPLPQLDTDCQRFFRRFPVETIPRCLTLRTAEIDGNAYPVFAPAPSLASFGWTAAHHLLVDEALAQSVTVMGPLGALPELTVVLAVNLDVPGYGATVVDGDDCRIMIYPDAQRLPDAGLRQVVAQQVGHCFQAATFPDQQAVPYVARRWREDGLATYLGGLVYPDADLEQALVAPLVAVDEPASLLEWSAGSYLWFRYLANEGGWSSIAGLVDAMPTAGDIDDQASALASRPGIEEAFTGFALAYLDGRIQDESGDPIPSEWLPSAEEEQAVVQATGPLGASSLPPFAIHRFVVATGRGKATLDASSGSGVVIRARPLTADGWDALPPTFPADCSADNRLVVAAVSVSAVTEDVDVRLTALDPAAC
jgi:hypothetical protein